MSLYADIKTLSSGSAMMMLVGARDCPDRLSILPANWTQCTIGLIASVTNLVDSNGAPNTETIAQGMGIGNYISIGMSNGSGVIGQAGNQFVGATLNMGNEQDIAYGSSAWWIGSSSGGNANWLATIGNGTTTGQGLSQISTALNMTDPTATTGFCIYLGIRMNVATSGSLNVTMYVANKQSSVTDVALMGIMTASYSGSTTKSSGGWWGPNPVGCRYIYIRWPFNSNRLRLHNIDVFQA